MSESIAPPSTAALHASTQERVKATRLGISLDWWSVIVAVALAVLLRVGILPTVPWDTPASAKPAGAIQQQPAGAIAQPPANVSPASH